MSNTSNNVSAEFWNLPVSSPQSVDGFGRLFLFLWLSTYLTWIRSLELTTHSEENLIERSTWNEHGSARDRCFGVSSIPFLCFWFLNNLGCLFFRVCVFDFQQEEEGRSKPKGKLPNSYWGWSYVCLSDNYNILLVQLKVLPCRGSPWSTEIMKWTWNLAWARLRYFTVTSDY